jgi:hypothetical protein
MGAVVGAAGLAVGLWVGVALGGAGVFVDVVVGWRVLVALHVAVGSAVRVAVAVAVGGIAVRVGKGVKVGLGVRVATAGASDASAPVGVNGLHANAILPIPGSASARVLVVILASLSYRANTCLMAYLLNHSRPRHSCFAFG